MILKGLSLGEIQNHLGPYFKPFQLFKGYFLQSRQQAHAQDYGYADFITSEPSSSMGARVYYSNENMIAYHLLWVLVQGVPTPLELGPMVMGPDALCYLLMDGESGSYQKGHSFTNEDFGREHGDPDFFRNHEVQFIGIPEPSLRKRDIVANYVREITRIRQAFGLTYDGKYIPIEQLNTLQPVFDMLRRRGEKGGATSMDISTPVANSKIRLTMDGSEPDMNSPLVGGPIDFSKVCGKSVKARLYFDGKLPGLTVTAGFEDIDCPLLKSAD